MNGVANKGGNRIAIEFLPLLVCLKDDLVMA